MCRYRSLRLLMCANRRDRPVSATAPGVTIAAGPGAAARSSAGAADAAAAAEGTPPEYLVSAMKLLMAPMLG